MKLLLCIYGLLLSCALYAQQIRTGRVINIITDQPIEDVFVYTMPGGKLARTDSLGYFKIRTERNDTSLRFSSINYKTEIIPLRTSEKTMTVNLSPRSLVLNEVTISDRPAVVYGSAIYWVSDYEFSGKHCLLLVYQQKPEQSELFVLSEALNICKTTRVPYPVESFFRDAFNGIHLIGKTNSLQINILPPDSAIQILMQESPIAEFNAFLRPIIAQTNECYFYEKYDNSRMNVSYGFLNTTTKEFSLLQQVQDTARKEMFDDELDRRERLGGSGGFTFLLMNDEFYAANVVYKHSVASRLFRTGDSIYVADLCNQLLTLYSSKGVFVRNTVIHLPDWEKIPGDVITDDKTGRAYIYREIKGKIWLTELNLLSGYCGTTLKLDFLYTKHLRIHDGWVWFLYRTRETDEHSTLYRQPL